MNDLSSTLAARPALGYATVVVLGLAIGSFLNVVIHRVPEMLRRRWFSECSALMAESQPEPDQAERYDLLHPPSTCPHCGHRIRPWENIPLLSFALLRGRCSACRRRISLRYPAVEALTALLSLVVLWRLGWSPQMLAGLVLTWTLVVLSFIDLDTQLLPDAITLPLLWAGLLVNLRGLYVPLEDAVIGAAAGYLILWSVYQLFRLATGKEGMGFGDFKLLAALGAWLGWQALPVIIVLSAGVGALSGILLMLIGRLQRTHPIPYGPFLAAAGWLALLWGPELTRAWLGMVR
ncbi:MAG TPA: prepilin peptidase [Chromatiales bacterium]|nr:prepilin peptidase [Chromatiales bacterium]